MVEEMGVGGETCVCMCDGEVDECLINSQSLKTSDGRY